MTNSTQEITELMDMESIVNDEGLVRMERTLLELWQAVLSEENIAAGEKEPITIGTALRVISRYPELKYADIPEYMTVYYACLRWFASVLDNEIESNPGCFEHVEDDAVENKPLYLNLIVLWQQLVLEWEAGWNPLREDAAVLVAAYADARAFVLGQEGMLGHLDQIGFEYSEADSISVAEAVGIK